MLSKLVSAVVAVVVVLAIVQVIKRVATRYIDDKSVRYRAREAIGFIGYLLGALVVFAMFSDRLGRLSVVFGVGGAVSVAAAAIELFPKTPLDIRQLTAKEG